MLFRDNRILFLDYVNIESAENITLKMNPPKKMGTCLVKETEWELQESHACSVVRWNDEYRFYYKSKTDEGRPVMAFVTSKDGINWTRPELGIVSYKGSKKNNLVDMDGPQPGETCVFVDPNGPDEHRFKMICHNQGGGGMWMLTSSDGLNFKRAPGHLLNFICDNNMVGFFDERIGKYRIYLRGWDKSRPMPPIEGRRSVVLAESDDLFKPMPFDKDAPDKWNVSPKWTDIVDGGLRRINKELHIALTCDEMDPPDAGLYQGAVVHYLPEVYLAFPTLYYSYPWPPEGLYINDGVLDIQFAVSHDGQNWQRDFRGSYVRQDLPDGPITKCMHLMTGMVPYGYTISQYYSGGRHTHGEGRIKKDVNIRKHVPSKLGDPIVHRLEQRMDGFVSADSAYTGGILTTKPFKIESDSIKLNIDTSASGVAWAALLDADGKQIKGYSLEECDRIQGNDTQYTLSWNKGNSDTSNLKGRNVKMLLKSRSSKLFAIYP